MTKNRQWVLKNRPFGDLKDGDLELVDAPIGEPRDGEVLIRTVYLSLDPTNRTWMNDSEGYLPPVQIGAVMRGVAQLTGGVPQLTPDLVEVCLHDWALDSSRAARELGYRPRPLREGLGTTLRWLEESGQWRR